MRLSTQKPTTPARTIAHWLCVLLCVGCGGKRFQSEADAGHNGPVSPDSVEPAPSDTTTEPFISTDELSDCDGGTGCNNTEPADSAQPSGPGSETTDVIAADAGLPNDTLEVDAAPGDDSSDVSTTCGVVDCATSSLTVGSSNVATTSASTSSDMPGPNTTATDVTGSDTSALGTTVPEETSTEPVDECPQDEDQVLPGSCGCGFTPSVDCETLAAHLVHRYSFDGAGTQLTDVVGDAHGEIHNCELSNTSQLDFDGEGCYVALPSGTLSTYQDATLEMWVRWYGGNRNQRIFNFGTRENDGDTPSSYISLSPRAGDEDAMTLSYRADPDDSSESLRTDYSLETGSVQHLAIVVDSTYGYLSLYQGDQLQTDTETYQNLAELEDSSVWLGRALYSDYPYFHGELLEFRIYDVALDGNELAQSDELGPDAHFATVE